VETVAYKKIQFTVWDVGGQQKIRPLWQYCMPFTAVKQMVSNHYPDFNNADGIIFVVDSSDRDRIPEAKEEIRMLMNNDQLQDSLLLVFANKQDMPGAMSVSELTDKLELRRFGQRTWYIQVRIPCPYRDPALMCGSPLVQPRAKAYTKA